jgi:hypothetical protein
LSIAFEGYRQRAKSMKIRPLLLSIVPLKDKEIT